MISVYLQEEVEEGEEESRGNRNANFSCCMSMHEHASQSHLAATPRRTAGGALNGQSQPAPPSSHCCTSSAAAESGFPRCAPVRSNSARSSSHFFSPIGCRRHHYNCRRFVTLSNVRKCHKASINTMSLCMGHLHRCSRLCVARAAHCCESSPVSSSSSSHTPIS